MNLIEFIFALLAKFVALDSVKLARLKNDGEKWYDAIDPESTDTLPLVAKLKKFGEEWYMQVALAILNIFAMRVVYDFLNPVDEREDEDDD